MGEADRDNRKELVESPLTALLPETDRARAWARSALELLGATAVGAALYFLVVYGPL